MAFGRKGLSAIHLSPASPGAEAVSGPLFNGTQYVGMVSPPGAYLEAMTAPEQCFGPGGLRGTRFAIETSEGPGYAFVFPQFASIWLHGEAAPRPQIPTEMIAGHVPGYSADVAGMRPRPHPG